MPIPAPFRRVALCAAIAAPVPACTRSAAPRGAAPATPSTGGVPPGPPAPSGGLPIPDLLLSWTPPMVVAGDPSRLSEQLGRHAEVDLVLGARLSGGAGGKVAGLVSILSPGTRVRDARTRGLRELLSGGALPIRRVSETSAGALPAYVWDGSGLDPSKLEAGAGKAVLAIDDAGFDEADAQRWRALPSHAVGGCEPVLQALGLGQERALALLEPFLDHGDAVVRKLWLDDLRAGLPAIASSLGEFAVARARHEFADPAAWERFQCGRSARAYVERYVGCLDAEQPCAETPRTFLIGGARIGAAEPDAYAPDGCAARLGRDHATDVRELGRRAAQLAVASFDPRWVVLADRLGTLTEVHAALEDVCVPRRRRFSPPDLDDARRRLARIGDALRAGTDEPGEPGWVLEDGMFHVPGVGPVRQLARFDAGPGSVANSVVADARGLREFLLSRAMCRAEGMRGPLAAVLADAGTGRVEFSGYFFEEQLLCSDLPPLH